MKLLTQPIHHRAIALAVMLLGCLPSLLLAESSVKIAWYGDLDMGLEMAKKLNRPILLISGAPHCHGVPGLW